MEGNAGRAPDQPSQEDSMRTTHRNLARLGALAAIPLALALGGCGGSDSSAPAPAPSSAPAPAASSSAPKAPYKITDKDRKAAKDYFTSVCVTCHGPEGRGDGPGGAALNPKPQNYHDAAWQAKVTDDEIETAIVKGGQAVGKSPLMAPNPLLADAPGTVAALREMVRNIGKQP
jgi:mono/diheme cytochrome c family protein